MPKKSRILFCAASVFQNTSFLFETTSRREGQRSWTWPGVISRERPCGSPYLVQKNLRRTTSWMPDGVSETERGFFLQDCGCFRSTMNAAAEGFSPPGGRFGPAPHSDGCFFSGMLPVPRSHHSPCCCPRCKATHPLHNEEEEEKWGDWGPLPAYLFPLDADLSPLAGRWTSPPNRSGCFCFFHLTV